MLDNASEVARVLTVNDAAKTPAAIADDTTARLAWLRTWIALRDFSAHAAKAAAGSLDSPRGHTIGRGQAQRTTGGATGRYVGTGRTGDEWFCYGDTEEHAHMCRRFDALHA